MVLPIISPEVKLTGEARRGLLSRYLPRMIEEGWKATKAYNYFKGTPLGIRKTEFLALYREVAGHAERSGRIRWVSKENVPSNAVFEPAPYTIPNNYRITYRAVTLDPETERPTQHYFGMDYTSTSTLEEMEAEAQELYTEKYPQVWGELLSLTPEQGYIAQGVR